MKIEKAKALNDFINQGIDFCLDFYLESSEESRIDDDVKECWSNLKCEDVYNAFLDELRDNMLHYEKFELIHSYVLACLGGSEKWNEFISISAVQIIQLNCETKFLIELKESLTTIIQNVQGLLETDNTGCSYKLWLVYKEFMGVNEESVHREEDYQPLYDMRFDFDELKASCDALPSSYERIRLINDRLIDLQQWELQNDIDLDGFGEFQFSPLYYPDFNQLCAMELTRQEKILELESKLAVQAIPIPNQQPMIALPAKYVWKAKDTDLLELSCSLCLEDAIGRVDGGKMTRKELIGLFEELFGIQIKDAEGKLNKATNRNDKTPFLDKLQRAFVLYARKKEESPVSSRNR